MIIKSKVLIYAIVVPVMLTILFPYFIMLSTSLKPRTEVYAYPPRWLPQVFKFSNFREMWEIAPLAHYMRNSIIIGVGATFVAILIALPAAYAISRLRFPGRKTFMFIILVTQMFSPIVVIIGLYRTMNFLNLLDTFPSLIITYAAFNMAFSIWLMAGYFSSIPMEIEEAALIDGCSRMQALFRVILPMAIPGVVTVVIFVFIWSWNQFLIALVFVSSTAIKPLTIGLFEFIGRYSIEWEYLAAASLVATVPVVVLFLLIEKHLVQGLTAGAIK